MDWRLLSATFLSFCLKKCLATESSDAIYLTQRDLDFFSLSLPPSLSLHKVPYYDTKEWLIQCLIFFVNSHE